MGNRLRTGKALLDDRRSHGKNLADHGRRDRHYVLCSCDCGLRHRDQGVRHAHYVLFTMVFVSFTLVLVLSTMVFGIEKLFSILDHIRGFDPRRPASATAREIFLPLCYKWPPVESNIICLKSGTSIGYYPQDLGMQYAIGRQLTLIYGRNKVYFILAAAITLHKPLAFLAHKLGNPRVFQLVKEMDRSLQRGNVEILPLAGWLGSLDALCFKLFGTPQFD